MKRFLRNINNAGQYVQHQKPRTKAYLALSLVCFFWGTAWLASKAGVRAMPGLQLAGMRQLVAGLCYLAFFAVRKIPLPKGRAWMPIVKLSLLNFILSNGIATWAVQYLSAGLSSILVAVFPLWIVIIGFFPPSKPSLKSLYGLVLGFTGLCFIFSGYLMDFLKPEFRFGILLSLISTWSWAAGSMYTKKHSLHFNPYFALGLQMAISGTVLLGVVYGAGQAVPLSGIPLQAWGMLLYLVLFCSIIAYIAYLYALQHLSNEQVSVYAYINPIITLLLGWMFFDEYISIPVIAGMLITLYGVWLVNKGEPASYPIKRNAL